MSDMKNKLERLHVAKEKTTEPENTATETIDKRKKECKKLKCQFFSH